MPEARLDWCPQWSHLSSGHTGANCLVDFFRECFSSSPTLTELSSLMQTIVDACGSHASKQSDTRERKLISSLPIPYCTNSLLYVVFIHGPPRFGGYDSCLVVTCGLSRFNRVPDTRRPSQQRQAIPPWGRPPATPAACSPHRACRRRGQRWAPTPTRPRPQHVGSGPQQPTQWAGSRGRASA